MAATAQVRTPTARDIPPWQLSAGYIPGGLLNNVATGTVVSGLAVKEYESGGGIRTTTLTFTAVPLTITDALAYAGLLVYTFPKGRILSFGADIVSLTMSVTSAANTLNDAAVVSVGLGTVTASSLTLATTMQNLSPGSGVAVTNLTTGTNPAASAVFTAGLTGALVTVFDGTTTPIRVFLNFGVVTNTEIDADATVTLTGTITFAWMCIGDH